MTHALLTSTSFSPVYPTMDHSDSVTGAENLLQNCAGACAGEHVLIVHEVAGLGFYDDTLAAYVTQAATDLGLQATQTAVGFSPTGASLSPQLRDRIAQADIVIFLARLGDQLRFCNMPRDKRIIVSYALSPAMLDSHFGTAPHVGMIAVKQAINSAMLAAERIHVTCPRGTDFTGQIGNLPQPDTSVMRFPMLVGTPVMAAEFSGRVALPNFLTGTGSQYYSPYTIPLGGQVFAEFNAGRLTKFVGDAEAVVAANTHYDHVAHTLGLDRSAVHSWHAGIHPGCGYDAPAQANWDRWGSVAFGNPRLLHFHTCGAYAPGEISWNVVDPTIRLDDVPLWDNGRLRLDLLPTGAAIMAQHPDIAALFAYPDRRIGF